MAGAAICQNISPTDGLLRRNTPNLSLTVLVKHPMITTAEYRAWAEQSLKWAHEAATENERGAYSKSAEVWLQSALRSERLSKWPDITTEYIWQLPPFQKWRRKGTPIQKFPVRSSNCKRHDRRSAKITAEQAAILKRLAQTAYEQEGISPEPHACRGRSACRDVDS